MDKTQKTLMEAYQRGIIDHETYIILINLFCENEHNCEGKNHE